ncbi:MAG: MFS transporter [Chloroflexi bacterium]|nr:MFS transporter [Chloroflexota bacterium]
MRGRPPGQMTFGQAAVRLVAGRAGSDMFRALRYRNFRLFWIGGVVSQTGTWMQRIAQAWLVLRLTDSPLALGTLTAVQFLPLMLFSLFGGVAADRFEKRRLMVFTQTGMLLQAFALGILTWGDWITIWQLYALALVLGVLSALDSPARQAFNAELVPEEDIPNAVLLKALIFNGSRLVGPSLGGLTIAVVGVAGCFLLNAASFLAVVASLIMMRPSEMFIVDASRRRGRILKQVTEGLDYARKTPDVVLIVLVMSVLGIFGFNLQVMLALIAQYVLQTDSVGFGLITSALACGSIVSAAALASSRTATRYRLLTGGAAFSIAVLLLAFATTWPLVLILLFLLGVSSTTFSSTANIRLQLVTPEVLRGRVMSIYTLLFLGSTPIGSTILGTLAEQQGVRVALGEMGAICCLGILAGVVYALRAWGRIREPDGPSAVPSPAPSIDASASTVASSTSVASNAIVSAPAVSPPSASPPSVPPPSVSPPAVSPPSAARPSASTLLVSETPANAALDASTASDPSARPGQQPDLGQRRTWSRFGRGDS